MNEKHSNSNGGFVWGLILGAAVGSLVSTQKGRQILKDLAEHGLESVENIVNLEEIKNAIEVDGEDMMDGEMEEPEIRVPQKKRLFKGIRKK